MGGEETYSLSPFILVILISYRRTGKKQLQDHYQIVTYSAKKEAIIMSEAKKIMSTSGAYNITEEDRKAALAQFEAAPTIPLDELLAQYKREMDQFLKEYEAESYHELMCRADIEDGIPAELTHKILDYYSFITRHEA